MKKIIVLTILDISIVGCELVDPNRWARVRRENEERGREGYERADGTVYCKDRYGNID